MILLPEIVFDFLSEEKGKLVHIINEYCKGVLMGKWLVIEETPASILIEVRYLGKEDRDNLCNNVFSYVDSVSGTGQRVRRVGEHNDILRIEVKWTVEGVF